MLCGWDDFIEEQKEMYLVVEHGTEMAHFGGEPTEYESNRVVCFRKEDADDWIEKHKKYLSGGDYFSVDTISTYFPGIVGDQNG